MTVDGARLRQQLDRLVAATTQLRHDGRFNEPNLDGTVGDYISFQSWEWPQGVGLYGLARLWLHGGDPTVRVLLENWYTARIAEGLPPLNVNTTTPMLALSLLWRETRDARWKPVLDAWADRVINELPRTKEGAFEHNVSDKVNASELWDDTIFMVNLFLASFGAASGREELVQEAVRQFLVHSRYLSDPQTGLWFHGWTFDGRHNFARARWARGNAWIAAAILDLVEFAPFSSGVEAFLVSVLESQVEALLPLQTKSGAWRTLLDDPSSYEEISATAGFGYALLKASRQGIGTPEWKQAGLKALSAVLANTGADGAVHNVSYGTRMGHDLQFYRDIPIQPTGYGQAMAILCLVEALEHIEKGEQVA